MCLFGPDTALSLLYGCVLLSAVCTLGVSHRLSVVLSLCLSGCLCVCLSPVAPDLAALAAGLGQLKVEVASIKVGREGKRGTTTRAELFRGAVGSEDVLKWTENMGLRKLPGLARVKKVLSKLAKSALEEAVQTAAMDALRALVAAVSKADGHTVNVRVFDGHSHATVGSLKPDVVLHTKGFEGELSVETFIELKRVRSGDFSDEEKGQVVETAVELLKRQPWRSYVLAFLTDGKRWQMFNVSLQGDTNIVYSCSAVCSDLIAVAAVLAGVLTGDVDVGFAPLRLPDGVTATEFLGSGGSSDAFRGKFGVVDVVVKVARQGASLMQEKEALAEMATVTAGHVPRLVFDKCGPTSRDVLCVTPVGEKCMGRLGKEQFAELVTVVNAAHEKGLLHNDIKPSNVYVYGGDQKTALLNDWGSSTRSNAGSAVPDATTTLFAGRLGRGEVRDRVMLVRTWFAAMVHVDVLGRVRTAADHDLDAEWEVAMRMLPGFSSLDAAARKSGEDLLSCARE